jgi:mono/diheme cytochrome c family protein
MASHPLRLLLPVLILVVSASAPVTPARAQSPPSNDPGTQPEAQRASYSGIELFRTYCAACHGKAATGDGPLAEHMKKRPPDLTQFSIRNGGTYPAALVHRIIDGRTPQAGHGGPDMPVWGDVFKHSRDGSSEESVQARIDALVQYLESVQKTAPAAESTAAPASPK